MSNYPPGTTTQDLKRAGIIDPPVDCPECGATVNEGEDHELWCECELSIEGMREYWVEARAPGYDDRELEPPGDGDE